MIAFTIPGEPIAFARAGANGSQRFTPKRQRDFMAIAKLAASQAMAGGALLDGPLQMQIRAVYPVPSSWSKKRQAAAKWRTARPDADNLAKIIADALNGIAYADDAQVASLTVQKVYGPRAEVVVSIAALAEA